MTTYLSIKETNVNQTDASHAAALATIRPIVEAQIGAHLAAQANAVTRYGVEDAAGVLHDAFGPEDALATASDPDHAYGPQPRRAVWWVETRSPLLTLLHACHHELHGADGGPCPRCGHDSHPIPAGPAPAVDLGLPLLPPVAQFDEHLSGGRVTTVALPDGEAA